MRQRLLTVLMILCVAFAFFVPAGAATVKIKGTNHAVDTFCGVPAYYDQAATISTSKWQCTEYVRRFYRDAYGLSVSALLGPPSMLTAGYQLQLTKTPKPGDIFFSPALRRGKTTNHWAIVKSYSDGYVTLIEQNHRYNGKASVNRTMAIPNKAVDFYTPVGIGRADPQLKTSQSPIMTKKAAKEAADLLEIGLNGIRSLAEAPASQSQAAAAQDPIETTALETETEATTQATAAVITTDVLIAEFIAEELAKIAPQTQLASSQNETARVGEAAPVMAAELALPAEEGPASRRKPAAAYAIIMLALLAICGFSGISLYRNAWFRRKIKWLSRKIHAMFAR